MSGDARELCPGQRPECENNVKRCQKKLSKSQTEFEIAVRDGSSISTIQAGDQNEKMSNETQNVQAGDQNSRIMSRDTRRPEFENIPKKCQKYERESLS